MHAPDVDSYRQLVAWARAEDLGPGDVTSEVAIDAAKQGAAALVFREAGVLCGMNVAEEVLWQYDAALTLTAMRRDGERVAAGETVGRIAGPLRSLLAAERIVLNFLQRLSGIATLTAAFVAEVAGARAAICDTRKTTPGWRALEKYAVRCGGGVNHRAGLYDAVLIKDNHLAALGAANLAAGLREALRRLAARTPRPDFVQVEVDNLNQLRTVLGVPGVDMVLLDNMTPNQLTQAVKLRDHLGGPKPVILEASGGVRLETVRAIAASGVERISVGALTHAARNLDIGLDLA